MTRKLTLDYGLRYDYQTYMTEQYGRMQDASFSTQDVALGRPGAVLYGASCNCEFSHNYPFAFGPRLGGAYQIDTKTVIRGGAGIQYDVAEAPNGVLYSAADYYHDQPERLRYQPATEHREPGSERPPGWQRLCGRQPLRQRTGGLAESESGQVSDLQQRHRQPRRRPPFSSTRTIVRGESSPGASAYNAK